MPLPSPHGPKSPPRLHSCSLITGPRPADQLSTRLSHPGSWKLSQRLHNLLPLQDVHSRQLWPFCKVTPALHEHSQSSGERGCSARGQAWGLLPITGADASRPPSHYSAHWWLWLPPKALLHMHTPCSSLKPRTPFSCTQKPLKKSCFPLNFFSILQRTKTAVHDAFPVL